MKFRRPLNCKIKRAWERFERLESYYMTSTGKLHKYLLHQLGDTWTVDVKPSMNNMQCKACKMLQSVYITIQFD